MCYGLKMTPGFRRQHVGFRPEYNVWTATKRSACRGGPTASLQVDRRGLRPDKGAAKIEHSNRHGKGDWYTDTEPACRVRLLAGKVTVSFDVESVGAKMDMKKI